MLLPQKVISAEAEKIISQTDKPRIALFRLSAIGDVVLWLSVIQAIQKEFPQAKITWITSSMVYPLLEDLPGVEFIVLKKDSGFKTFVDNFKKIREKEFDVLLAGQASLRANLFYPFIKANLKIGFSGRYARDGHSFFIRYGVPYHEEHLLDRFMRFAAALGVKDLLPRWQLPLADSLLHEMKSILENDQAQKTLNGPWIALSLSASKEERNWPQVNYLKLMREIRKQFNARLVIIGGPSKKEILKAQELCKEFAAPCLNLTAQTSLKQLAALLKQVDLLISPDSAALHIANAVNTACIGLHAVISAKQTGAYSYQDLAVDFYPQAVKRRLQKSIDSIPFGTRVHDSRAMQYITVEAVVQKVSQAFSKLNIE